MKRALLYREVVSTRYMRDFEFIMQDRDTSCLNTRSVRLSTLALVPSYEERYVAPDHMAARYHDFFDMFKSLRLQERTSSRRRADCEEVLDFNTASV